MQSQQGAGSHYPFLANPSHQLHHFLPHDPHWHENDWAQDFIDGYSPTAQFEQHSLTGPGSIDGDAADIKGKVSDAVTYGPRFCTLFESYRQKLGLQVDTKRHLMSLCVEHVISFVKWARESDSHSAWISCTLLDNDYLRPEVRNGVVMVLIYAFASIKAAASEGSDMFTTLQDQEQGLGIANKFSLKIYNDPFNFLSFLKTTISALIDAGAIPDNERQNQPKKSKLQFQNREELQAFARIQRMLVEFLDSGNNAAARQFVQTITSHWQLRGKVSALISFLDYSV